MIIGRAGVVGFGAGSSRSSSSGTGGMFSGGRDRVVLVVTLEGPTLAVVVRVVARVGFLVVGLAAEGSVERGLVGGGCSDIGFACTSAGRIPGGLRCRLGASVNSTGSTSIGTTSTFLVVRFDGAFSTLDGSAAALDRVDLVSSFFFRGSGGFEASDSDSIFAAARRVIRVVVRGFGACFAGVTGPSDRSLRREGSDGRDPAGAFRFGGIVSQVVVAFSTVGKR